MYVNLSVCTSVRVSEVLVCNSRGCPYPLPSFSSFTDEFFLLFIFLLTTEFWSRSVSILLTTAFHQHDGIFVLEHFKVIISTFLTQFPVFLLVCGILLVWL